MVPAEVSPAALFAKLFLQGDAKQVARETQRLVDGGSILDHLRTQTDSMRRRVSTRDRQKLDAYFDALRSAERELTEVRAWLARPKPTVDAEPPRDIDDKADLIGRVSLMLRMIPLILETDSSRVVSLMIQDHGVSESLGVTGEHHGLSHHGQDEEKIAQLKKVETALVAAFGDFLGRMAERDEHGRSLLDTTSVLFGSNLGNANSHSATRLPILLAGGPFTHGKHVVVDGTLPLSNLFVTLLNAMGRPTDTFGHSTGALAWS